MAEHVPEMGRETRSDEPLTIVIVGASGHLARTKIVPALFALFCQDFLPAEFSIVGFARTDMSDQDFRVSAAEHLTCRYSPEPSACETMMDRFLEHCRYRAGQYDSADDYRALGELLNGADGGARNLLVYLAVPPHLFGAVARALGEAGLARRGQPKPWTRAVIEKPFGHDRPSSDALAREMGEVFDEEQIYRIDHYLGKEVVQNLLVLRFANLVFEPMWNRHHIRSVQITWQEDSGIQGRGGYFDEAGIIRDVMQNHLLQMLSLVAMEPPTRLDATHIRDAKVNALVNVPPLSLENAVIGQYAGVERGGIKIPGYRDDPSVPDDSRTPTFAAAVLHVQNARWDGVPFLIRAGKGLKEKLTEIRIRFAPIPGNLFHGGGGKPAPNELVIRVQPDESIYFTIVSKVPGLAMKLEPRMLDLQYESAFSELIPDAYEDLLLDVLGGEKSLFIREDELAAAWDIVTPLLHAIDERRVEPEPYAFGGRGPAVADALAAAHGVKWE